MSDTALRLAQHLASERPAGRCELTDGHQRCPEPAVAVRWEHGFADWVCEQHADSAHDRGALLIRPLRHDGTSELAA